MKTKRFFTTTFIATLFVMTISFSAMTVSAQTFFVTPSNNQGFEKTTLQGGTVSFISDTAAPSGGALRLTTTNSNDSYAAYTKETDTPLAGVTELSYLTKRNSGPIIADASFALGVDLNGTTAGGNTFLIYEPYLQQPPTSSGTTGLFTFQDVDQGRLYSSSNVTCSNGTIQAGAPGNGPFYNLNEIQTSCPEAVVELFGVFIGTFNRNYDVEVDLIKFNGTIYDFQPDGTNMGTRPENKEQCKNGGFAVFTDPQFKNQGQCVAFVNASEKRTIKRKMRP